MLKKLTICVGILLSLLLCASCTEDVPEDTSDSGGTPGEAQIETIPLSEEEAELLDALRGDLQTVAEADYPNLVTELQYHADTYKGQVFQMEGILKTVDISGVASPFVYRTLNNAGEKTECGLPLQYLYKDIPDGSWVKVTGIIGTADFGGDVLTVIEVVAVEVPEQTGNAELSWDGSPHNH